MNELGEFAGLLALGSMVILLLASTKTHPPKKRHMRTWAKKVSKNRLK